jgi:hypothetical protein
MAAGSRVFHAFGQHRGLRQVPPDTGSQDDAVSQAGVAALQ